MESYYDIADSFTARVILHNIDRNTIRLKTKKVLALKYACVFLSGVLIGVLL